jgi:glycosyltransferase involved in cell wall biosynthesis
MGWLYDFSGLVELTEEIMASGRSDIKLLVVGKGDIESRLSEMARGEAKGILLLEGWKPFNDVVDYMNAADICVMPFQKVELMNNAVPIKIIEYLASGKPVISTPLDGVVLEFGKNGGILYANSSSEFIEKVNYIDKNNFI